MTRLGAWSQFLVFLFNEVLFPALFYVVYFFSGFIQVSVLPHSTPSSLVIPPSLLVLPSNPVLMGSGRPAIFSPDLAPIKKIILFTYF